MHEQEKEPTIILCKHIGSQLCISVINKALNGNKNFRRDLLRETPTGYTLHRKA